MDSLTWFKSVLQRGEATPAPLRADRATERRGAVSLHVAAARLRPTAAPAAPDGDWDAAIARAKMRAEMPDTPPPSRPWQAPTRAPARPTAPRAGARERANATLDAFIRRGQKTNRP